MRVIDYELSDFPGIALFGHIADDYDVGEQCPCENAVVTGFVYVGDSFSVRSHKLNVIAKTDLVNRYGERITHEDCEADVVKAIGRVWPGMAPHV